MLSRLTAMNLLPRDDVFFDLFEQHAAVICEASELFATGVASGYSQVCTISGQVKALEERGDEILQQIVGRLQKTFLTPFDPADVHALAAALDDVLDSIEDAAFRIAAYRLERIPAELGDFSRIVQQSCRCLQQVPEEDCPETAGDRQMYSNRQSRKRGGSSRETASGRTLRRESDPVALLACKELFEVVERITDRCDDVANLLETVSIKA